MLKDEIIEFLIFQVGEIRCGINILETEGINWVPAITPFYSATEYVTGLLNLRGQVITVLDLGKRLGGDSCQQSKNNRIIIIKLGMEYIGLLVDSVTEVIEVQAETVEPPPANTMDGYDSFFRGIIRKDNKLITILNVGKVVNTDP